jgi:VanZ family protein
MSHFSLSTRHCLLLRGVSMLLAVLLILGVFWMADSPLATGALSFTPPLDKLLHAGVYGSIAALLWFSGMVRRVPVLWLLVVGIGLMDELQQRTIAGRESSVADLLADMAGVTLGLWLASWLLSRLLVRRP